MKPHGNDEHLEKLHERIMKLYEEEEYTDGEPEPYNQWKKKINSLMTIYNVNVGSKYFELI